MTAASPRGSLSRARRWRCIPSSGSLSCDDAARVQRDYRTTPGFSCRVFKGRLLCSLAHCLTPANHRPLFWDSLSRLLFLHPVRSKSDLQSLSQYLPLIDTAVANENLLLEPASRWKTHRSPRQSADFCFLSIFILAAEVMVDYL